MRNAPVTRGYTLLELIVTIGLFSVVMFIVMTSYFTLISADRHARSTNQLVTSLSFAVESMSRSLRTGSNYVCGGNASQPNCTTGGDQIYFEDSQGDYIAYIRKSDGTIGQCLGTTSCTNSNAQSITDPRIQIPVGGLRYYVRGENIGASADTVQPTALIVIQGTMATDSGESTGFLIQAAATQRIIEL